MIKHEVEVTKILYASRLTKRKYRKLLVLAKFLRDCRNKVSEYLYNNIELLFDMSKKDFVKHMRAIFEPKICSSFDYHVFTTVYTCYKNRLEQIQKHLDFESHVLDHVEYYAKNCKGHKKGDIKKLVFNDVKSSVHAVLIYLARYGNEHSYEYITNKLSDESLDDDSHRYYSELKRVCDKLGFKRLYKLAINKRERVRNRYNKNLIVFKSLTFSGRSRKKNLITKNKNKKSCIELFLSISGVYNYESFDIPIDYNKHYHGKKFDIYNVKHYDFEYTITFDEFNRRIRIHLAKDENREFPIVQDLTYQDVLGGDVNTKHNMFALSDGKTIDFYDRKLIQDFIKLEYENELRKKKNESYVVGARRQHKMDVLKNKMTYHNKKQVVELCNHLTSVGCQHFVMEDLKGTFGKCYVDSSLGGDENIKINYNKIVGFVGLSSLKDEFKHIAMNYGICLSLCHAAYTS